jgi:uncharacterized protein (DUF433 family)
MTNVEMKKNKLIEIREGAAGKHAYVGRTRIQVLNILTMYEQLKNETLIERILIEYPQLTPEHVQAALDYGREHPEEMEREIAANEAALARLDAAG